ncbi:hypothetical protein SS52_3430 [Escherichia coli O157:H7 str. SS52]|nr:hypothetical protein SS17_3284 [Escherichia coli O157:H7 str. SS17]AJA27275.1 hypothetical protein SS52_3430 [Escherichia coli O157:H7 str. SS52]
MKKATTDAPASFLLSFAQSHLNGGLCGGGAIRAGSFFPVTPTLHSSPPSDWRRRW